MRYGGGGALDRRVQFQRRTATPDAYGNVNTGAWATFLTAWGKLVERPGREALAAGRLEGMAMGELHVRDCAAARAVLSSDRLVIDAHEYQIRDIRPPQRFGIIVMVVERGVST